jgi:cytochrome c peroxidase
MPVLRFIVLALLCGLPLAAAGNGPAPYAQTVDVARLTTLGRAMFFDRSLSASGQVACASCHAPRHAYGPPPGRALPRGALRAVPSLRYLQTVPPFSEHHFDTDGDDSIDAGPTGGHTWDGRASSAHEQARLPLLSPAEMGNRTPAEVVRKLARSVHASSFRALFGDAIFADLPRAFDKALLAFEVFQQSPAEFYPYSSHYDAVLRGQATLSPQERRGLALFNDADKGNCAACHRSEITPDGAFPLFTDFGHIALGLPRNHAITANHQPRFFDLGLCGPLRTDLAQQPDHCGRFRAPSLRNVALRERFFHNGVVRSLPDAVRFYVERDTRPARWYRHGQPPRKYDDLPADYHANVNTEPPFGGAPGDTPRLGEQDIRDIVAFLKTLTDADQQRPASRRTGR